MKQNFTLTNCLSKQKIISASLLITLLMVSTAVNAQLVKQYAVADVAQLKTDIIAGTYDIFELTDAGGLYVIQSTSSQSLTILKNFEIRAVSGLATKPVLSINSTGTGGNATIFYPNASNLIIKLTGIEFDGVNTGGTIQNVCLRAGTAATNCQVIIRDCYFHNFLNAAGNGTIRLDASSGSSMDIQGCTFNNCAGRILYFYSADATSATANGDLILKNNTFCNITATTTNPNCVVHYKSTTSVPSIGTNAYIDHCTFYNFVITSDEIFKFRSMTGVINITNCIFDQIPLSLTFAAPAPTIDYCYLAGFGTPPTGTNTVSTALPGYTNATALNFGLVNVTGFTGSDAKTIGDTRYYGTPTSIKGTVQLSGNGKSSFRSYPNPASEKITLDYTLDKSSNIKISVYNLNNQLVKSYMNNEPHGAGSYTRSFDVSDLKTGVYFVRMTTGMTSKTVKVVVKR
jgi:hypothetical protein